MELKMKYHYSYFIYPYIIKENNYNKYIKKLLKNEKFTPKFFEREKDLSIYNYFLPTIRDYMFKSFNIGKLNNTYRSSLDEKLRESVFKSSPCAMFEYNIGLDAQAKTDGEDGIFFKIHKIEIVCFKTGICFLLLKTSIEDTDKFSDLLNFNVKFRDINGEVSNAGYNNIKIQTSTFGDIKKLSEIIREITGSMAETKKLDVNINRFLTYSYVCIDGEYWNDSETEKFEVSTVGVSLITSSVNTENYTSLPFEFENEYLYTYIFSIYQKLCFKKMLNDFEKPIRQIKARKEFVDFTNDVWVHEITAVPNGMLLFRETKEVLELNKLYETVKEQYDVTYKNFKMKNSDMLNRAVLVLLAASIVTNIVNFINLYKIK